MLLLYKKYTIEQYKLIQVCVTNKLPVQYIHPKFKEFMVVCVGWAQKKDV